jgi:hypothetical protein
MRSASGEVRLLRLLLDVLFLCAAEVWAEWLVADFALVTFFEVGCVVEAAVFFWLESALVESARTGETSTSAASTPAKARAAAAAKTVETGDFIQSI